MPPMDSVTRRIAGKQLVVFGCSQEADDAQLDDEVVDDFLRLFFVDHAGREIALEVDDRETSSSVDDMAAPFCSFTPAR